MKHIVLILSLIFGSSLPLMAADPHPDILRVMSYNTWYVFAKGQEQKAGMKWVGSRTPDVVALQELTNIKPDKLQEFATAWGHDHSSLLKTSGFSVGLTSRWEIEVVEKGLKGMHHGFLHAKTNRIHYFLVHLSPFKWEVRQREADILMKWIQPLLEKGEKVMVLGDFNAVSPEDRKWLEAKENARLLKSRMESDAKHGHVQNLKDGKFDYGVMESFFKGGLVDSGKGHLPETFEARLSIPTGIWTDKKSAVKMGERIDFILVSKDLHERVKACEVVTEGEVNRISDHYPVISDFAQ